MSASASIFSDFNLPNSTTWFYFSFLLAIALFFKFGRFVSMRNWDVLTLFLLVPGMLFIQQARQPAEEPTPDRIASLVAGIAGAPGMHTSMGESAVWLHQSGEVEANRARILWIGYLWLLC